MQSTTPATDPTPPAFAERTSEHLYAIVHRWPGTCQPQEQLQPPEQSLARNEDAREALHLREHFVHLGDFPTALRAPAILQKAVHLVDEQQRTLVLGLAYEVKRGALEWDK